MENEKKNRTGKKVLDFVERDSRIESVEKFDDGRYFVSLIRGWVDGSNRFNTSPQYFSANTLKAIKNKIKKIKRI
jgi:hypothetical protein